MSSRCKGHRLGGHQRRRVRLPQLCHRVSNRCGNRVLSAAFVVDVLARALSRLNLKTDREAACLLTLQNLASNILRCVRLRSYFNGLTYIHTSTYEFLRGGGMEKEANSPFWCESAWPDRRQVSPGDDFGWAAACAVSP